MQPRNLVDWLKAWMAKHPAMTQLEISEKLGFTSNGAVSQVLRGQMRIPLKSMDDWADAMRIRSATDRAYFRLLVQLDHATNEIRDSYWSNLDRLDALERAMQQLPGSAAELSARIQALEAELVESRKEVRTLKRAR